MKKYLLFLLVLFPFSVFAKENVFIENVEVYENNHVEVVENATFSDLNINANLRFAKVGSYIIYKVDLKNNSLDSYEIDRNSFQGNSDSMEYSYNCGKNSIINPKSKVTCYVKITYQTPPSIQNVFYTKTYHEDKEIPLELMTEISNPFTSNNLVLIFGLFIVCGVIFILSNKKKTVFVVFIGLSLLVPIVGKAFNKVTVTMNNRIEILDYGPLCNHEIRNFKDYIMCSISQDFVDFPKVIKKSIIDDYNQNLEMLESIECQNEMECDAFEGAAERYQQIHDIIMNNYRDLSMDDIKDLLESDIMPEDLYNYYSNPDFNYLIGSQIFAYFSDYIANQFDWEMNDKFSVSPNHSTYFNYPEGIYVDNQRFIPIMREITDKNLEGYSFTKMTTDDSISDVVSMDDLIHTSVRNNNGKQELVLNFKGGFKATKSIPIYGEIERFRVNGDFEIVLSKDNSGNVVISDYAINPESLTQILYGARFGLINNLIDLCVNKYRMNINNPIESLDERSTENLLEQLFSRYYQLIYTFTGIRKRNIQIQNDEVFDYKEKEIIRYLGINYDACKYLNQFDENNFNHYKETGEFFTQEQENDMLREYYRMLGVEPFMCEGNNRYHSCEEGYLTYYPLNIDFSRYRVIYDNKFYEGEDGFFQFVADYLNINTNGSNNIKTTIYNHLTN